MPASQSDSPVNIKTPLGADVLLLRDMSMTEELSRLFSIDLNLLSEKGDIKFEDILGQNVTIELKLSGGGKRFFNGHVTSFSQAEGSDNYASYQATVKPWFWFLTRTADCRIFQEKTVPEIIEEVFGDLGFTDFKNKLTKSYRTWEYCVQYRETDFNFVSRLLEQEGIYYYFTHDDGVHKLILCDDLSAHQPLPGYAKIDFFPPDSTAIRKKDHVIGWNINKKVQPGKYQLNEFDFKKPSAELISQSDDVKPHAKANYEIYDYPGEYVITDDGDKYAQARIEELHSGYEQAEGRSGVRVMNTGALFTLDKYHRADQNREYLITRAEHNIHSHVYGSGGGNAGELYNNRFFAITSKTPYRAARVTPKPIVQGTQTAIVVGPSGEEIYTDEYGRVKLQFHWDRYGNEDENSSCWVRVAQIWAGKKWGGIHIPRIGQEVIVDFMEGDPDRPIITGRVYNAEQMPPYDLPANKTQSGVKSRSSKSGTTANFNEIRMEDKKGSEELYIHAEKNHTNITENNRNENVGNDRKLTVGNDKFEEIENNKDIKVTNEHTEDIGTNMIIDVGGDISEAVTGDFSNNSRSIYLTAQQEIVLETGASKITMSASGDISIEGLNVSVSGSMTSEVTGGMVRIN